MVDHSPSPGRARSAASASSPTCPDSAQTAPSSRAKRRKYTAVACDECRRRKLKCLPGVADGPCQRCAAQGVTDCSYLVTAPTSRKRNKDDQETVLALSKDVKLLSATLSSWMSSVGGISGGSEPTRQQPECSPLPDQGQPTWQREESVQDRQSIRQQEPTPAQQQEQSRAEPQDQQQPYQLPSPYVEQPQSRVSTLRSSYGAPEEPRFLGPTRPVYSLQAGEKALSRLGIPTFEIPLASGQQSPIRSPTPENPDQAKLFWERCDCAEFARLMNVFEEEIEAVYPCIDSRLLTQNAAEIIELARMPDGVAQQAAEERGGPIGIKDLHLAQLAIASAIVLESRGLAPSCRQLIAGVERCVLNILEPSRELKSLQLLVLLSIYYFHDDHDVLAWRTIGLAAREALVMGLHRKASLFESFREPEQRDLAVKVFWTIYVLDRRWSFGTSLSFALVDRDIDPELPEPGDKCPYLQCMLGYGRLSTALWEPLLASLSPHNSAWTETTTREMDIRTQEWLDSIPPDLRMRHPRLGLAARAQEPVLQRLRALLYLRGNHFRILIYRYYLLAPSRIKSAPANAWLAVEIAQDSIQVLVHLNDSSDIYRRQQAAFNYFLVSALAVLFLAVCNDPETFAAPCKISLHSAIELLRYFSRHSCGSRWLWSTVRKIVPRLRGLEAQREAERRQSAHLGLVQGVTSDDTTSGSPALAQASLSSTSVQASITPARLRGNDGDVGSHNDMYTAKPSTGQPQLLHQTVQQPHGAISAADSHYAHAAHSVSTPDVNDVGSQLLGLYEMFEQGQAAGMLAQHMDSAAAMDWWGNGLGEAPNFLSAEQSEFAMNFNGLI